MITTVTQLKRNPTNDEVVIVYYDCELTDGEYYAYSYGSTSVSRTDTSPTFIDFDKLTKETVIGWLSLDPSVEADLIAQIAKQKLPTLVSGTPW
jgi:hypothetical protein|tara:strand:+ start:346 stop:627 length:282 start_codon:yes stop_codon:yes gene_type:complete